jgi:hypothetical protein
MVDEGVQRRLREAEAEAASTLEQRDRLNIRLIELQRQIKALWIVLIRDAPAKQMTQRQQSIVGLTDAIRSIVRIAGKPMTAGQIKDGLRLIGFDFSNFSNASAAVHNTLKRLAAAGELQYIAPDKAYRPNWLYEGLLKEPRK